MGCACLTIEGQKGFICGEAVKPCDVCGEISEYLCDYPVGKGKRCDLALCELCAIEVGNNFHLCPIHITEYRNKAGKASVESKIEYGKLKIVK